ncbi:amidophosphoribosyltransferase [Brevibacillus panacihumi W25]|uniref:Amidophosphoribosyltransferase n=1 Tax=Brevibacillus panacihumi W25 TaxID=1408254 RepID=V6MBX5_9BACL|nr:ComF family protein [Brevibacillus panacihumi]EST55400.1 amidophosphoribosyltransferase [Brevibacillus panacihumi W25]
MSQGGCVRCGIRYAAKNRREAVVRSWAVRLSGRTSYAHMYRLVERLPLCAGCLEEMPVIGEKICEQCGRSWEHQGQQLLECGALRCRDCRSIEENALRGNRGLLHYDEWGKDLLGLYKYRGDERLADFFGKLLTLAMYRYFRSGQFDYVVAVPLHPKRLSERGFNQMEIVAERIGRDIGVPARKDLIRTKETAKLSQQTGREARILSMQDAFAWRGEAAKPKKPSRILLLDDIYTTGSTLRACAQAIHQVETVKSYIWSLTIYR